MRDVVLGGKAGFWLLPECTTELARTGGTGFSALPFGLGLLDRAELLDAALRFSRLGELDVVLVQPPTTVVPCRDG
jgi:hypothetical protein